MINKFRGKYFFLSNFYNAPIKYNDLVFKNNESAFQAMKTLNEEARATFTNLEPSIAKKKGMHVKLRHDWEAIKYNVMYEIVKAKFTQNLDLKQKLLNTKNEYLEEGNTWHDYTWGVCNGRGKNYLGKILMKVRQELNENKL